MYKKNLILAVLNHFLTFIYNVLFHILLIRQDNPRLFISYLTQTDHLLPNPD